MPTITSLDELVQTYLSSPLPIWEIIKRANGKRSFSPPPKKTKRRAAKKRPTVPEVAWEAAWVQHRTYIFEETGEEMPYALFVPPAPAPPRRCPLLLALHGHNYPYDWAMGIDGLLAFATKHAMLVVAPLGYTKTGWYGAPCLPRRGRVTDEGRRSEADVLSVLRLVREEFEVDATRCFAWGFSAGGSGALHFALKQPGLFRGIGLVAPAIGAAPSMLPPDGLPPWTQNAELGTLAHTAVAVVYGTHDHAVDTEMTRGVVDDFRRAGVSRLLEVEVAGGEHDCEALTAEGVLERMLKHMWQGCG